MQADAVELTVGPGALSRPGAKPRLDGLRRASWERWRGVDEARRAMRFIQALRMPETGELAVLAPFQRRIVRATYANLLTVGSLPSGNAKTTLMGLVGLERICRGDPYTPVVVLATKHGQAREVVEAAKAIAENDARLVARMAWYEDDGALLYRPTGASMVAHSARLKSIEGLRYRLALIDEIGFALDELVTSIIARLGKGTLANRILGMGTPGFEPNVLHRIRELDRDGGLPSGAAYLEWSAPDGCDLDDRQAWLDANPAVTAGFLSEATYELQLALMPERQFRVYHLGQWVGTASGWLPQGAWDACPYVPAPPDGTPVVLGVEGTYRRTLAVVGAAVDGSVFAVWVAEAALDDELRTVLAAACERWQVEAVVHSRRIRVRLFAELARDGMPLEPWTGAADLEAGSANELWRDVSDRRLAHDHDPVLAEHMANLGARWMADGSLRLIRRDDDKPADAALAARMAWWRARELADVGTGTPTIY
ncbi:MAG TPA: hypothetical protein VKB57_06145 [Acidimicrobiales bacterium]|nr:hypothetical protein [Acidimicrobiales bacterium]